ncbi:Vacuolar protein sorting-associated protein 33B [Heterocephalus glaber]|uniref:Vacuolar protein sorting-associated protein 33B n=1 Tax=Heterocephalus glaber TaxID=10181 RepID=G5CAB0_HETGA|nr:Vacuolar protein sorting-associated protein 33B [Heterocephalus glaber]
MAFPHRPDAPELPDFSMLKRLARDQLIYLLEQLPGKKDLFIEPDLMSPLDRIANVSILKQHEVDKLYKVENKLVLSSNEQLCFLVRPRIKNMYYIANLVKADKLAGRTRKYKVIFSPQKFYACEMVLEEEGIYGDVSCDEWAFSLLPLDVDLLSMELPEFFRDYFLEGDQRWINTVTQALHLLSTLYGPFPNSYGIGRCAKMSYELWRKLEEEEESETKSRRPEIGHIFLLDRDMDFVTALCSQVVYEGLVDDTFRIKCGSVDFGPEVTSSEKSLKVLLNADDKVFSEIRNEHFSNVFGFLSQKARNLQSQYDRRRGMDIKQMKNFVSQELKGLKQEHRLLSLRRCQLGMRGEVTVPPADAAKGLYFPRRDPWLLVGGGLLWSQMGKSTSTFCLKIFFLWTIKRHPSRTSNVSSLFVILADIGACESIMKKKTKQDFQELIKTEHALLEGFNIRESTSYIEEHIDRQVSPIESLRLMCLLSITENGLIPKDYRSLKTQYLQSYGPEHLLTFSNLRRAGLLTEQAPGDTLTAMESKVSKLVTDKAAGKITDAFSSLAKRSNFRAISKKLNLIPRVDGEYDLKVPRDMAYVFSGAYVPLSCRIIEQVLERRSWQGLEEVVRLLNCSEYSFAGMWCGGCGWGCHLVLVCQCGAEATDPTDMTKEDRASSESLRLILVVFLGGCTFSEISALRFLGREKGYRFIFLTTAVTNSARLMEAMSEVKT